MRQPAEREQLGNWLDDAYAMENGLLAILQAHAEHFDEIMPSIAQRIRQHATETQTHAARLEQCLRVLGRTPSSMKSAVSSVIATVEGSSTALFADHIVKDILADYASEQLEVACYTALVATATRLGLPEVARLCGQNLQEDQTMAAWLLDRVPAVLARAAGVPQRQ